MNEKYRQITESLKKDGGRLTEQRKAVLKAVLKNPGSTCKEIFYISRAKGGKVSLATIYRTIRQLEKMGYI